MSSFIVNQRTMHNVISGIEGLPNQYRVVGLLRAHGYDVERTSTAWECLGCDLFGMNGRAVEARYGDGEANPVPRYRHRIVMVSLAQAVKSAHCLDYQCTEGAVPEEPLYRLLNDLIRIMEQELIGSLPEYKAATWNEDAWERAA